MGPPPVLGAVGCRQEAVVHSDDILAVDLERWQAKPGCALGDRFGGHYSADVSLDGIQVVLADDDQGEFPGSCKVHELPGSTGVGTAVTEERERNLIGSLKICAQSGSEGDAQSTSQRCHSIHRDRSRNQRGACARRDRPGTRLPFRRALP